MAMLKDSLIAGDLRVTGTIYGDVPLNDLVDADDLKAIEALTGTSGLLKKTANNTWTLDTNAYTTSSGVTSVRVQATSPVVSSVNTAQTSTLNTTISLADNYGDTKNPYASKTARYVLAAPATAAGAPTFRQLTNADVGLSNVENTKLSTWAGSSNITTIGTLSSGTVPWARLSDVPSSFTPSSHTHGNITNDGKIGTTANQGVYTTTNGVLTAGTIPVAAGGTGATTAENAVNNLLSGAPNWTAVPTDSTYFIRQDTGGTNSFGRAPFSTVWTYIKGKADSVYATSGHNHDSTYVNVSGDTMTGALTLSGDPTSAKHAATKQYVDQSFAANDAMIFKGTIAGGSSSPGAYTVAAERGHTYKVSTAGYVNGDYLEAGDILICTTDSTAAATSSNYSTIKTNWTVVQTNLDGAVIGPASATDKQIAIFNGTSGKVIKGGSIGSHSYTPAGTITLTNGNTTTTVSAASSGTTTYTPGGTVSQPTFTGSSLTSTGNFTPAGSVSVSTNATTNKTATVSAASSGTTTYTPGGTNSAPAFTGTAATIVVSGGTGTATYTPAGTIAVNGTTSSATVVKTATFNTVVTQATVTDEVLTITTGASGSSTNQTGVRIADPAYTFTGTGTRLTASYTPAGSVAAPTFTGTAVRLVTGNIAVPNTYTATFTGTQGSISVSGTPAGTVSQPTFSGTAVRLVTGNISRPTSATFSGTAATLSHSIS